MQQFETITVGRNREGKNIVALLIYPLEVYVRMGAILGELLLEYYNI